MLTAVVSRPRRVLDRRSPAGARGRRPAVRPVARSGDLATTWSLAARIPGSYFWPVPMFGTASAGGGSAARRRATLSTAAEQATRPGLPRRLGRDQIYHAAELRGATPARQG